ncbi:MAG: metal-dependent transcriptional regulator [Faecousia sp.]
MDVHESGEMYLEAILVLRQKNGFVRSVDVGEYLGYSKPSVSRAMSILRTGGYVQMDKDGGLTLTDAGREIAEKIFERHTLLSQLLIALGVPEGTAIADACKMEHAISDESFQALKRHMAEQMKDKPV